MKGVCGAGAGFAIYLMAMGSLVSPAQSGAFFHPFGHAADRAAEELLLQSSQETSDCPTVPTPVVKLATESVYNASDPAHAEVDPEALEAYQKAIKPVRYYARQVVRLANGYIDRRHGAEGQAACTLWWLKRWAQADALTQLETHQANLGRGAILAGISSAYLQIGAVGSLSPGDMAVVQSWLEWLAEDSVAYMDARPDAVSSRGNHRYWNGLGVALAGIAAKNQRLLDWGLDSFRLAARQVDKNGMLPLELKRGKRARDYHIFATAPLVMLAEIGSANGIDLYGFEDGALHRLVTRVVGSLSDPRDFEAAAGRAQMPYPNGSDMPPANRLAWLEPYLARFPDPELEARIAYQRPLSSTWLGGDLSMLFAPSTEVGQ